jgi:dTDP-4-amino-4,6-dideoxygalactose transaminase
LAVENGTNSRLDEIQASILNFKLKKLNNNISLRKKNAKEYYKNLKNYNLVLPQDEINKNDVYYEFVIRCKKRSNLLKKLKKNNINLKITYPYPIHTMKPYKKFYEENLINTEKFSKEIFSLPVYPGIKKNEIKFICKNIINNLL